MHSFHVLFKFDMNLRYARWCFFLLGNHPEPLHEISCLKNKPAAAEAGRAAEAHREHDILL
jgi:hypothetical protein